MVLSQQSTAALRDTLGYPHGQAEYQCLKQPVPIVFSESLQSAERMTRSQGNLSYANLIREGYALYESHHYRAALSHFNCAVDCDRNGELALHGRGLAYAQLGHYRAALSNFERALRVNPKNAQLWYNHAMALAHLEQHRRAIQSFDRSTQFDPSNHRVWYNRARSLRACSCYHGALENLNRTLNLKADCHYAWSYRGIILAAMARYHEAIANFNSSLRINERDLNAWCGKAHAALHLNDLDSAIRCLYQALKVNPTGYQRIVGARREFDSVRRDHRFIDLISGLPQGSVTVTSS